MARSRPGGERDHRARSGPARRAQRRPGCGRRRRDLLHRRRRRALAGLAGADRGSLPRSVRGCGRGARPPGGRGRRDARAMLAGGSGVLVRPVRGQPRPRAPSAGPGRGRYPQGREHVLPGERAARLPLRRAAVRGERKLYRARCRLLPEARRVAADLRPGHRGEPSSERAHLGRRALPSRCLLRLLAQLHLRDPEAPVVAPEALLPRLLRPRGPAAGLGAPHHPDRSRPHRRAPVAGAARAHAPGPDRGGAELSREPARAPPRPGERAPRQRDRPRPRRGADHRRHPRERAAADGDGPRGDRDRRRVDRRYRRPRGARDRSPHHPRLLSGGGALHRAQPGHGPRARRVPVVPRRRRSVDAGQARAPARGAAPSGGRRRGV